MHAASLLLLSTISATPVPENIVLEFTADWCGGCQQMSPIVSALQRKGYPIRTVDADRESQLLQRFGVNLLPTFVLLVDGKEVDRIVGGMSQDELRRLAMRVPKRTKSKPKPAKNAAPKRSLAGSIVEKTKKALTPRIKLPIFGRKKKQEPAHTAPSPIVRAQLGEGSTQWPIDPLRFAARLKLQDDGGISFGSGTVIASEPGRALILTCGHIFREMGTDSRLQVDVFGVDGKKTYDGEVVRFDEESDIGLVAIACELPLSVSQISTLQHAPRKNDAVISVGCGNGDDPTKLDLRVTALNRYLGPDNIECTGVPVQGRSGGGLFNSNGEVIGICVAADPKDQRGLYTGLQPIHEFLDSCGLSHLIRTTQRRPTNKPPSRLDEAVAAAQTSDKLDLSANPMGQTNLTGDSQRKQDSRNLAKLDAATTAALEDAGEAEVVCIIRPINGTRQASRVVIINRASKRFVANLTREARSQTQPTSLSITSDARNLSRIQNQSTAINRVPSTDDLINRDALAARRANRWKAQPVNPALPLRQTSDQQPRRFQRN